MNDYMRLCMKCLRSWVARDIEEDCPWCSLADKEKECKKLRELYIECRDHNMPSEIRDASKTHLFNDYNRQTEAAVNECTKHNAGLTIKEQKERLAIQLSTEARWLREARDKSAAGGEE